MRKTLKKMLSNISGMNEAEITDDLSLLDDLNIESISFVDLLIEIERETGKKIDFSELAMSLFELNDLTYSQIKIKDLDKALIPYLESL
jgi:acyl carrier protein